MSDEVTTDDGRRSGGATGPGWPCSSTVNQPAKISDYCMICDAACEGQAGHPQNRKLGVGIGIALGLGLGLGLGDTRRRSRSRTELSVS